MSFEQNLILKNVLVAPLDWGLGHAARCIPIIQVLQNAGYRVTIAAPEKVLALLANEFPAADRLNLFGYNVRYAKQKRFLPLKIMLQAPKIVLTIIREHIWLKNIIRKGNFDLVISDNRYGLFTNKIPCIFITHQLVIKAPFGWLEQLIQLINYRFINKFSACWVPDFEAGPTIAGVLSHPKIMPLCPVTYIGPLSRLHHVPAQTRKYEWLVVLSGPEPQRTILEEKILQVVKYIASPVLLVRGRPGDTGVIAAPENVNVVNHLSTSDMQEAFAQSEFIISRCGYTTVMEVLALGKRALLIPTPGQTEQEYLAKRLFAQKWCYCCMQEDDLLLHINIAKSFDYQAPPAFYPLLLRSAINDVVTAKY